MLFFDVTVGDFIPAPPWNPSKVLWSEERIGLDYETYSPTGKWEGIDHHNGRLRLIMVYLPSKKTTAVIDYENMTPEGREFVESLKGALTKGIETIAHSATFEYKWTRQHLGVKIKRLRCTLVCNQMLDAGLHLKLTAAYGAQPNSLKNVVKRRLGFDIAENKKQQATDWGAKDLSPEQLRYAALDPYLAYSCYMAMLPKVEKLGLSFKAEMLAIPAFAELEFNGMPGDRQYLAKYALLYKEVADRLYEEMVEVFREEYKKHPELVSVFPKKDQQALASALKKEVLIRQIANCPPPLDFDYTAKRNQKKLQETIGLTYSPDIQPELYETALRCALRDDHKRAILLTKKAQKEWDKWAECRQWVKDNPVSNIVAIDIKIRSPQQVKPFLEHLLGVTLESTESEELMPYIDHPFVLKLIEYRSIFKLQGYLEGYLKAYRDGAVFGSYSQLAVSGIGRSDSSVPNLQNVPKMSPTCKKYGLPPVRGAFRLEDSFTDLEVMGLLDAAGSHLQIARDLSRDPNLLKALNEAIKVHYITCQAILKIQGREETLEDIKKACAKGAVGELAELLAKIYPQSKTLIYAFLNLAGPNTLSYTFTGYGDTVSLETCKEFLAACKLGYQGLWAFIQKILKDAKANTGVLYDTPRVYNPVVCEMIACGFNFSSCVNHSHWLGEFTTLRTIDGRVLNLEKGSRKTAIGVERYIDGARVVSSNWLAPEATAMKLTLGLLALWAHNNPQYGFKLRGFAHDEVIFTCLKEHQKIVGDMVYNTMRDSFRRVCPNFAPEDSAFDGWVVSWQDK